MKYYVIIISLQKHNVGNYFFLGGGAAVHIFYLFSKFFFISEKQIFEIQVEYLFIIIVRIYI